jgi:hypothetical protein
MVTDDRIEQHLIRSVTAARASAAPEITANWIANGNKWTVPIGGGVSKLCPIKPSD